MRNICLINRYYPPNPGISGEAACDLVSYLVHVFPDATITVIHVDAPYLFEGVSPKKPVGNVICIKTVFGGSHNLGVRFIRNLIEGYRLVKKALKDADIILSMTDPPLLNYWTGLLCCRKNRPWIYWAIDLYPHAYKAARLVGEKNVIYNHLDKSFRKNAPSLLIALGEAQAYFLQEHWGVEIPQVILPCGIQNETRSQGAPFWSKNDGKIYFAYAGNMGDPHDPDFLLDFIRCLDAKVHKCILALYGSKAQMVLKKVKDYPAVEIVQSIKRSELSYIDVHLVNLLPEWTHISVPSKAVSAVCAGQTILFNGTESSDTWQMLHEAGWIVAELKDRQKRKKAIDFILSEMSNRALLAEKKKNATHIRQKLFLMENEAYSKISEWIKSFN